MKLSFYDNESFMEVAGSLRFNNPPSDPSTVREVGSTTDSQAQPLPGEFPAIDSTLSRVRVLSSLSLTESLTC